MSDNLTRWSELYDMDVVVPSEGKSLGHLNDFYFQTGTDSVYALSVATRLYGNLTLVITGIVSFEGGRVNIRNEQMLSKAVPPFASGQKLLSRPVVNEKGSEMGTIKDVLLGIDLPQVIYVAGYEMTRGSSSNNIRRFGASGVDVYDDENGRLILRSQVAKQLR